MALGGAFLAVSVTVIGLGLIGTSIGMALKRSKITGLTVTGHDREPVVSRQAQKQGGIDKSEWNLPNSVRHADIVVVATPVMAIKEVMEEISPHLREECIVTDTGSTKAQVLNWADDILPRQVNFVGGHPMAGKETAGPDAADATLFNGKTYCVIPGSSAKPEAVETIVNFVQALGAKPFFVNAFEHDALVAGVSHLPMVLSSALMACVVKSPSWHEMAKMAASGFRDVTRLASGDPEINRDICVTNAKEIGPWVDRLITELLEIRKQIDHDNDEQIARHFAHTYEEREKWVAGAVSGPVQASPEIPGPMQQMTGFLVGDLLASKSRALLDKYQDQDDKRLKRRRGDRTNR